MIQVPVSNVSIVDDGRLLIRPELPGDEDFRFIYRAGMEVGWEDESHSLYCPKPREWSYVRWFKQAVDAVAGKYHRCLALTASTEWRDVPAEIRAEIEALMADSAA